jgi:hypothetical protein
MGPHPFRAMHVSNRNSQTTSFVPLAMHRNLASLHSRYAYDGHEASAMPIAQVKVAARMILLKRFMV